MRRVKRWTVVSLSVILAAVALSLLYAQQGGASASPALRIPFDEALLERYRVDIQPTTPDTGIETGCLFAFGYYLVPPYAVGVQGCSVLVNGVCVFPEPEPEEVNSDSVLPRAFLESQYWQVRVHLDSICAAARERYREGIRAGLGVRQAESAAVDYLLADRYVDTVMGPNEGELEVRGVPAMLMGKLTRAVPRFVILSDLPPSRSRTPGDSGPGCLAVATGRACAIRGTLLRNRCAIETYGYSASKSLEHARQVASIMVQAALTDRELWVELSGCCGYGEAMSLIANRREAATGWGELLSTIGGNGGQR